MKKISIKNKRSPQDSDLYYVGIDAGSVSLNCIVINDKKEIVYESPYERHLGKVEEGILACIEGLYEKFGRERIQSISFTGNHGKKLSEELGTFYEFETISQVLGSIFIRPDVKTIISIGGQETALLQISHYDGGWELEYFIIPMVHAHPVQGPSSISRPRDWPPPCIPEKGIFSRMKSTKYWLISSSSV
jgi:activator of 2-hydroxyglutaryl-CoA dehydratase